MMNTKPKISLLLNILLALCIGWSAAACSRATTNPTQAAPPIATAIAPIEPSPKPFTLPTPTAEKSAGTVSIWHSWDEANIGTLEAVIKEFQSSNPDVLFDVLYVPMEVLFARYVDESLAGGGPALLLGPAEWGPGLYDFGLLTDLTLLAAPELLASLNQPALGGARFQDALIGLPYAIEGVVLYRNKDIMTITADTFDELVTLAEASTQGEDVGAVLERSFLYSGAHLLGLGGKLEENGMPAFNDTFGIAWLELLRAFERAGPTNYLNDEDLEAFKSGRVGWLIDGTWNMQLLAETIGEEDLAIDPWPTFGEGALSGFVMSHNLYLNTNAQSENRQATWNFIKYFLTPAAQTLLAETQRIPAGVIQTETFPLIDQAIIALSGGTTYPFFPEIDLYQIHLDIALRSFFFEGIPAPTALQVAEEAIRQELSARQPTPTASP